MDETETDSAIHTSGDSDNGIQLDSFGIPLMTSPAKLYSSEYTSGITLAWKDVSVYVPLKKSGYFRSTEPHQNFKRVLNNVTGVVYPGSLTALMGSSGAGKTSLLSALGHKAKGDVEIGGEILVNGESIGSKIGNISGFVYQEDLFVWTLTVSEHLHLMANIKLDKRLGWSERKRRVEELLIDLSLKKCENTRIGMPAQQTGISGGERKRLAFATEILTNPPLLFCDEPTTGLDSYSAKKIVGMLKTMANQGNTILCTIHQPSSEILSMFDQLCLLAEGRSAYMGSTEETSNFMKKLGYECPLHYNLGDFYIRTLSIIPGSEFDSRITVKRICDNYAKSPEADDIQNKVLFETNSRRERKARDLQITQIQAKRPSWFRLTALLTKRAFINITRDPRAQKIRLLQKFFLGIILGLCYMGIELNQEGIQNVQGVIFLIITESSFPALYGSLLLFPTEFPLFLREQKANLYQTSSYYFAKVLAQIPGYTLEAIVLSIVSYWLVGLRPDWIDFFLTCSVVILTVNISAAAGSFFSAACGSVSKSSIIMITIDYILMVSGGQFINLRSLPVYVSWVKYLSWFMYSNEAISIIQWTGIRNISCANVDADHCATSGDEVLTSRSFDASHLNYDFVGLTGIFILFHLGGYLGLVTRSRNQ